MIQKIGESLPAYEEYFKMFMTRRGKTESKIGSALPTEIRYRRLYKALSYVYADIVQFCQESRKIFETKRGSVFYRENAMRLTLDRCPLQTFSNIKLALEAI
jgi:hypothetical protein